MITPKLKWIVFVLLNLLLGGIMSYGQSAKEEQHILVSMRMIGHQILLNSGDSTSRVFPIEKKDGRYKIQFASAFSFNPGDLVAAIDRVVKKMKTASSYIVEVSRCENDEVVYSYEKGDSIDPGLMACGPRFQPKACYIVFFTILKRDNLIGSLYHSAPVQPVLTENKTTVSTVTSTSSFRETKSESTPDRNPMGYSMIALPIGSIFAFIGLFVYFRKKRQTSVNPVNSTDPNVVMVGESAFDQKNMTLLCGGEKIELSSKECDLLSLLSSNENKTLEREYLLKVVWGDEGDYIGRTLDVFISKLRKKLEADPSIKIVNIRGIGYKFIVNQ